MRASLSEVAMSKVREGKETKWLKTASRLHSKISSISQIGVGKAEKLSHKTLNQEVT